MASEMARFMDQIVKGIQKKMNLPEGFPELPDVLDCVIGLNLKDQTWSYNPTQTINNECAQAVDWVKRVLDYAKDGFGLHRLCQMYYLVCLIGRNRKNLRFEVTGESTQSFTVPPLCYTHLQNVQSIIDLDVWAKETCGFDVRECLITVCVDNTVSQYEEDGGIDLGPDTVVVKHTPDKNGCCLNGTCSASNFKVKTTEIQGIAYMEPSTYSLPPIVLAADDTATGLTFFSRMLFLPEYRKVLVNEIDFNNENSFFLGE